VPVVGPELDGIMDAGVVASEAGAEGTADAFQYQLMKGDLRQQEFSSAFLENGELHPDILSESKEIMTPGQLGNLNLPPGLSKFTTPTIQSPFGDFQVHFYMNAATGEPYYGLDFKYVP
jgi:hypothetical protein